MIFFDKDALGLYEFICHLPKIDGKLFGLLTKRAYYAYIP
jgi:hypothetical protein